MQKYPHRVGCVGDKLLTSASIDLCRYGLYSVLKNKLCDFRAPPKFCDACIRYINAIK